MVISTQDVFEDTKRACRIRDFEKNPHHNAFVPLRKITVDDTIHIPN